MCYFEYGDKEINYLKSKDKKLAEVIERIGHINRVCMDNLFEAVVNSIIGQQISTKAHVEIWQFCAAYVWYTITKILQGNGLRDTERDSAHIAAWQACILGLWQEVPFLK